MTQDLQKIEKQKTEAIPKLRFREFDDKWNGKRLSDWKIKVLDGDRGKNYPNGDDFSAHGFCLFLNAKNVTKTGFSFIERSFITKEKDGILRKGKLQRNDIVLTTRGSVGHIALYDDSVKWKNLRINSGMVLLRTPNINIEPRFLYILLISPKLLKQIQIIAFGSAQPQLTVKEINRLTLKFPTLSEQQKIASFLSAVDKKIQQLTRKKELLETYKKSLMQQLFSQKIRFKNENGKNFPEWEEKTLKNRVSLIKDGTHGTHKDVINSSYYLLSAKNIYKGKININQNDRQISKREYNLIFKNFSFKKGDIFLSIVGTIGRSCVYKGEKNVAFQRSVAFFRFPNDNSEFIYQFFNSSNFQKELKKRQVVSAQPGIYLGDLSKIEMFLPSMIEQQKIADFLSAIDKKTEAVSQQIDRTQSFKKGLLQQMFV